MMGASRRFCQHVPRKCRGMMLVGCFACFVVTAMLVGQASVFLAGIAARETGMTEAGILDAIPRENNVVVSEEGETKKSDQQQRRGLNLQFPVPVRPLDSANQNRSSNLVVNLPCRPLTKLNYLFIMRIPKSASTSLVDLLQSLANGRHLYLHFDPSGAYNWDDSRKQSVVKKLVDLHTSMPTTPIAYARHFYHVNFTAHALGGYKYLTIMREPVNRFVSSFLYYHYSSKGYIQAALDPRHRNESIIDCLKNGHEGCSPNLVTKYFCGHEGFCKDGSARTLLRAKENLVRDFAVVGILEELELSYRVFGKVLPEYFGSVDPLVAVSYVKNSNQQTLVLTDWERLAIATANSADVELYAFTRELLHRQASGCGLS